MHERLLLWAGAVVVAAVAAAVLGAPAWLGFGLLAAGLVCLLPAAWLTLRRRRSVRLSVADHSLHPVPVLDAPAGTFDLITGLELRVDNLGRRPLGVRVDTVLCHRAWWQWERKVSAGRPQTLLPSSVVPAGESRSLLARNYIRIPGGIETLDRRHFVKLLIEITGHGVAIRRVFLPTEHPLPGRAKRQHAPAARDAQTPWLPFPGWDAAGGPEAARALFSRLRERVRRLVRRLRRRVRRLRQRRGEPRIVTLDDMRHSEDTFDDLVAELEQELEGLGSEEK